MPRRLLMLLASIGLTCTASWSTTAFAGQATLSWVAPFENVDGSPLNDLAGYLVAWGRSSGQYTNEVRVEDPDLTGYVVDDLSEGEWFFAVRAFNEGNIESEYSNEDSKVIQDSIIVYSLSQSPNRMALVPIGTADIAVCDLPNTGQSLTDSNGITARVVPFDMADFCPGCSSVVVFAECGAP